MKRRFRLTRSTDFKRVRRLGKSYAHPLVVLLVQPNPGNISRIGITASRAVGSAVQRNRVKRRLRAVLHELLPTILPGWDLVFLARQPLALADFGQVQEAVFNVLKRSGLMRKEGQLSEQSRISE